LTAASVARTPALAAQSKPRRAHMRADRGPRPHPPPTSFPSSFIDAQPLVIRTPIDRLRRVCPMTVSASRQVIHAGRSSWQRTCKDDALQSRLS
jgi:hypothetical protein